MRLECLLLGKCQYYASRIRCFAVRSTNAASMLPSRPSRDVINRSAHGKLSALAVFPTAEAPFLPRSPPSSSGSSHSFYNTQPAPSKASPSSNLSRSREPFYRFPPVRLPLLLTCPPSPAKGPVFLYSSRSNAIAVSTY